MSGKRGPVPSSVRVARLLTMLPWLVANGPSVAIKDMAAQFGLSEDELLAEIELASTCGLPPYTPDMLTGIWIEEGTINVFGALQFDRRLELTSADVRPVESDGVRIDVARRLRIVMPHEQVDLSIEVDRYDLNPNLPPTLFSIAPPRGITVEALDASRSVPP